MWHTVCAPTRGYFGRVFYYSTIPRRYLLPTPAFNLDFSKPPTSSTASHYLNHEPESFRRAWHNFKPLSNRFYSILGAFEDFDKFCQKMNGREMDWLEHKDWDQSQDSLELDDDDRSMNVNVDGGGNPHLKPLPRTAAIRLPLFMTSQIRSREKRTID